MALLEGKGRSSGLRLSTDVVAVSHVDVGCGGVIDGFDVVDEDKDAARKDEHHGDDAEGADGIEAQEDVYSGPARRDGMDYAKFWDDSHARGGSIVLH